MSLSLSEDIGEMWDVINGDDRDLVVEGVFLMARVDNPQVLQTQVLHSYLHRSAPARRIAVFELKPVTLACRPYQQVQFGACMGRPEVGIAGIKHPDDAFHSKSFPRWAEVGMPLQISQRAQLKQSMQNAAVPDIYLGSLDLSFAEVLKPGRKNSDHVCPSEDIEISASRVLRGPERSGKLRRVPDLAMIMCDHSPKSSQGFRGDRNPELGDVSFQKGADEVLAPSHAGEIVVGQKGPWEPAAHPKASAVLRTYLQEVEPRQVHKSDAPCKRFRHAFDQLGGSGAQQKVAGWVLGAICQNPQQFKQVGPPLHFVDNYQPGKLLQRPHGRRQTTDVNRVFEIKVGTWLTLCDHSRQRSLTALPRALKGYDRVDAESIGNTVERIRTRDHTVKFIIENRNVK